MGHYAAEMNSADDGLSWMYFVKEWQLFELM